MKGLRSDVRGKHPGSRPRTSLAATPMKGLRSDLPGKHPGSRPRTSLAATPMKGLRSDLPGKHPGSRPRTSLAATPMKGLRSDVPGKHPGSRPRTPLAATPMSGSGSDARGTPPGQEPRQPSRGDSRSGPAFLRASAARPLLELIPPELVEEGAQAHAEELSGVAAVAPGGVQRPADPLALQILHLRLEGVGAVAVGVAVPVGMPVPRGAQHEVVHIEAAGGAEDAGALHRVPELADVSRPRVFQELAERPRRHADGPAHLLRRLPDKARDQRLHVLGPLAERRNVEVHHVQPIIEIAPELAAVRRVLE